MHLLITLAAVIAGATATAVPMNIVETASATPNLSTLVKALQAAKLADTLSNGTPDGPFTVFAPTDLAFAELPQGTLAKLLDPKNLKLLQDVLLYHVANGTIPAADLGRKQNVTMLNGESVLVVTNLTQPNQFGELQVFVNQAKVTTPNVMCSNGIVHIINSVLIPQSVQLQLGTAGVAPLALVSIKDATEAPVTNIVEAANATADLSILVKALQATMLTETLSGPGPFTVFAPTDLAFDELPPGTLANLLDPKNLKQLKSILLYHVVSGDIPAADFGSKQNVTTLNGESVLVVTNLTQPNQFGKLQVFVNQAKVTTPNVMCSNGIVHIINSVLLP